MLTLVRVRVSRGGSRNFWWGGMKANPCGSYHTEGVGVLHLENVTPCNYAIFIFEGEGLLVSADVMKLTDLNDCIIV